MVRNEVINFLQKQEKERKKAIFVDAGDLGILTHKSSENIDRDILVGIIKALSEKIIPVEKRDSLWSLVKPDEREVAYRDLAALSDFASATKASKSFDEKTDTAKKAEGGGSLKAGFCFF